MCLSVCLLIMRARAHAHVHVCTRVRTNRVCGSVFTEVPVSDGRHADHGHKGPGRRESAGAGGCGRPLDAYGVCCDARAPCALDRCMCIRPWLPPAETAGDRRCGLFSGKPLFSIVVGARAPLQPFRRVCGRSDCFCPASVLGHELSGGSSTCTLGPGASTFLNFIACDFAVCRVCVRAHAHTGLSAPVGLCALLVAVLQQLLRRHARTPSWRRMQRQTGQRSVRKLRRREPATLVFWLHGHLYAGNNGDGKVLRME